MFLVLALIAIAGGALVTYLFDEDAPLVARLCMGVCLGFAALGLGGFILASIFGLNFLSLTINAILLATPPLLLLKPARRREQVRLDIERAVRGVRRAILHPTRRTNIYIVFSAFIALLLWLVFDRAMIEFPDGIYTGVKNNYGDLPFHLSVITGFSDGANFPPEDPTWAGARFTYPFIADFVAACFVRAGASLRQAMLLENYLLALSFVGLLYHFTLKLTRDWLAGLIAPLLVLFSGGLGWWYFLKDSNWSGQGVFKVLFNLQQQFTITMNSQPDAGLRWGNSLTTLLVPQRGILFGLPLALIVFTTWWTLNDRSAPRGGDPLPGGKNKKGGRQKGKGAAREADNRRAGALALKPINTTRRMAAAGIIAGLLPLIHAHSFVVVMVVGAGVALLTGFEERRAWLVFFLVASLIAAPQMWWATHGSSVEAQSFFGFHFGWDKGEENFFWFWFKNTGLFIPLIFAALLWPSRGADSEKYLVPRRVVYFYLPFTLCFIAPNFIKLAPWVWDNIKVIFYWFIASVPLVALIIARLLRERFLLRAAAVVLLLTLVLSGALDVWSVASRASEFSIFDADGVAFAEVVKEKTRERATILHAPTFDTPIFLTGRRSVMGYPGHISSHGIKYEDRLRDIMRIYAGAPDAEALLEKYGVEYAVVGPQERQEMMQQRITVNDQFFKRFQVAGETGGYTLYKIARP